MQKYIQTVVETLINSNTDFNNVTLILPSKRAGVFFKRDFKNKLDTLRFLPEIISIEDFISDVSKIESADNLVLLFEFYKIYCDNTSREETDSFEDFSNWASILITDFNEIDSYLIDPTYIFSYLQDIDRIENWFKGDKSSTELTDNYLRFFGKIALYYQAFYKHLVELQIGYQGLQYREASIKIDSFINLNQGNKYIFIGFNALNKTEEIIIQKILENELGDIYFDIDSFFINENISAANFVKQYKKWNYFTHQPFHFESDNFSKEKNISIVGVPKNVSQIKYANEIIANIEETDIALVLAQEELLTTAINSLPNNIDHVNITMGFPLKNSIYADIFHLFFKLHKNKEKLGNGLKFYYKDVLFILNHPTVINKSNTIAIVEKIKADNHIFLDKEKLLNIDIEDSTNILQAIFGDWSNCKNAISYCFEIIQELRFENNNHFELEYLTRFEQIFIQIQELNRQYGYITTLEGLNSVFKQILQSETLAFKGEALKGLQVMGMLETRVLDFENVIITSVNEGFLPNGKTNNSFIPFDVKNEMGLPTYQEKDAIFSYHFYRLISRAKNVFLLYNTESDDLGGGEQSRFITQLEFFQEKLPNHHFSKTIVSPKINNTKKELQIVAKNESIKNILINEGKKGFSPTSLTNYIYNPIAFYKKKVLKIYPLDGIEEIIAANTLGTVVHRVLEDFYTPFKNKFLKQEDIAEMLKKVSLKTQRTFAKEYKQGDITKGKNLLIFEVAKQYIISFLKQELQLLKENNQLKIIDLEVDLSTYIKVEGLDFPIRLKGQADRIDLLNGTLRIIDYKTGAVKQTQLNVNWDQLIIDHKYSKAFQVLFYAYVYIKMNKISIENTVLESGIVSFKNLKEGFLKINKAPITNIEMDSFEDSLKELLLVIYSTETPFLENENLPY